MMRAADGLIVVKIEGWDESEGIAAEVKWCEENGKPILFREEPQT
jgi:SpoU rRNA methylase family enzyme